MVSKSMCSLTKCQHTMMEESLLFGWIEACPWSTVLSQNTKFDQPFAALTAQKKNGVIAKVITLDCPKSLCSQGMAWISPETLGRECLDFTGGPWSKRTLKSLQDIHPSSKGPLGALFIPYPSALLQNDMVSKLLNWALWFCGHLC